MQLREIRPTVVSVQDATPTPAPPSAQAPRAACDACGAPIVGEPGGRGLYVWTRGDETRYEEPPLCEACALAIFAAGCDPGEIEEEEG